MIFVFRIITSLLTKKTTLGFCLQAVESALNLTDFHLLLHGSDHDSNAILLKFTVKSTENNRGCMALAPVFPIQNNSSCWQHLRCRFPPFPQLLFSGFMQQMNTTPLLAQTKRIGWIDCCQTVPQKTFFPGNQVDLRNCTSVQKPSINVPLP